MDVTREQESGAYGTTYDRTRRVGVHGRRNLRRLATVPSSVSPIPWPETTQAFDPELSSLQRSLSSRCRIRLREATAYAVGWGQACGKPTWRPARI